MPVEAPALLRELSETWRSFGRDQSSGLLRACAMTLIVAAAESDDPQELGSILSSLMRLHPSRTIVLRACPNRDEIDARTSVQCWMPFGRHQQICGEWIEIYAGAARLAEVVPLLLGLTVPDLPVVLWMRHTALAFADSLRPVLPLATRVIVDTSEALDAAPALAAVRSLTHGPWRRADLAWGRVTRWRKALAGMLAPLPAPQSGRLQWAGEKMSMPACYLAAWLRACFPGLALELSSCDPVLPPAHIGRIRVVQLTAPGLDIRLERPAGGSSVTVFRNGLASGLVFPSLDESALLAEELGIAARDRIYESALAVARAV